jgi:hypothetical protein
MNVRVVATAVIISLMFLVLIWNILRKKRLVVYFWAGKIDKKPPSGSVVINLVGEESSLGFQREFFLEPSADVFEIARLMFPGALFLFED